VTESPRTPESARTRAGLIAFFVIFAIYGSLALTVNLPATGGFKGDEATYYMIGHSLVADGDLAYRRADLERVWKEYPSGPAGVFLKRGQRVTGMHITSQPPFLAIDGRPDPDQSRLFYGKSFIYPALAAPFVWLVGTNGFLVLNALLLAAAFLAGYVYLSARTGMAAALVLAGAFVFASVMPVYAVWITPELFNCSLGLIAFFFWLHKHGREHAPPGGSRWLYGPPSDYVAAALLGILTFSKVTNVLLAVPFVASILWRREWRHALVTSAIGAAIVVGLFGINTAVTGDWNYQGGLRSTFYINDGFPFQAPDKTFDVGDARARNEGRADAILDPDVFWTNLFANLRYVVVGRYAGLVAYFLPGLVGLVAMLVTPKRRTGWQWLVFGSVVAQILLFVVSQPYTYFGSGGSVGNRYFVSVYGLCLFLLPAVTSARWGVLMWLAGALFVGKLLLNPFEASVRPWIAAGQGPLRLLPPELTNINDLPINVNRDQMVFWYGGDAEGKATPTQPAFQIYYLDQNAYLREADRSLWIRGESRAEVLIKTDQPFRRLQLTLLAGPVPATGSVRFRGRSHPFSLAAGASQQLQLELGPGFPYKMDRDLPAYIWRLAISTGRGFVPHLLDPASPDVRYLGVNVRPIIIP
jgi:hypothetical protein